MAEQQGKEGEKATPVVSSEDLVKLQEQITNLNKGIASYRDQTQTFQTENEQLKKDLEEFKSKVEFDSETDKELELNPEDQKKLEEWARKKGFVTKDELETEKLRIRQESYKNIESQAISEFLEKHKEYDKDEEWAKVQAEFQFYKTPTTLDGYRKLLNKIHSEFSGGTDKAREEGKAQARAELITKGRLSLGGGTQGEGSDKGLDLEALQKRYPNLSKEQILERVSEINALYPKEKK